MKNKKGNIPIAVFVLGVIAMCAVVIGAISFDIFGEKADFSDSVEAIEELNVGLEKFYFYQNAGESFENSTIKAFGENFDKKTGFVTISNKEVEVRYKLVQEVVEEKQEVSESVNSQVNVKEQ